MGNPHPGENASPFSQQDWKWRDHRPLHLQVYCKWMVWLLARPHLLVNRHQRTVSTSKGCNQWLSLAKTLLKVALAGGDRSLVARTSKCGWAISQSWATKLDSGRQCVEMNDNLNFTECPKIWLAIVPYVSTRGQDIHSQPCPFNRPQGSCDADMDEIHIS